MQGEIFLRKNVIARLEQAKQSKRKSFKHARLRARALDAGLPVLATRLQYTARNAQADSRSDC